MNFDAYMNPLPCPAKEQFTTYYLYKGGKVVAQHTGSSYSNTWRASVPGATFSKELNDVAYHDAKAAYYEAERKVMDRFTCDLFDEYGVSTNPKAKKCLEIAYEMSHSGGYSDIASTFGQLVDLIVD